jgi:hypothetical protein
MLLPKDLEQVLTYHCRPIERQQKYMPTSADTASLLTRRTRHSLENICQTQAVHSRHKQKQ